LTFAIITLLAFTSCAKPYGDERIALGTLCSLSLPDGDKDGTISEGFFSLLGELDRKFSASDGNSEISRINKAAGIEPVSVSDDVFALISKSLDLMGRTDGAFNPLLGSVIGLWAIGSGDDRVPEDDEIEAVLPYADKKCIVLDSESKTVFLTDRRTQIHLGAIAKGYISEALHDYLVEKGVKRAIINLGGNVYTVGAKRNGEKWRVAIQKPYGNAGESFYSVLSSDDAVVTSGAYQRFETVGGKTYHHIFDPKTGKPSTSDVVSATVISSDGAMADAFSTAVFVLGSERGGEILRENGLKGVILTEGGEVITL